MFSTVQCSNVPIGCFFYWENRIYRVIGWNNDKPAVQTVNINTNEEEDFNPYCDVIQLTK